MSKNNLQKQIDELKKENQILKKRDKSLRIRFAYMMWSKWIKDFDCDESKVIAELDRLDSCCDTDLQLLENKAQIVYLNRNWFVNTHLDHYLSKFN